MKRNVLVIEDNADLGKLISLHLGDLGCEVRLVADGMSGFQEARARRYDLIVLDVMLPGMDGIEICRKLRGDEIYTPIVMLTAKSSEVDRVLGLERGADDYVTKPFSIHELLARVKALLRRVESFGAQQDAEAGSIELGDLVIDIEKRSVRADEREVQLTAKEFDLLVHFAQHPGRVYSRAQLLDSVWGYGHAGYEHTVNSHINRLRSKIEANPAEPRFILTVWGVGYKFNEQAAA